MFNRQIEQQIDELDNRIERQERHLDELKTHVEILQQAVLALTKAR